MLTPEKPKLEMAKTWEILNGVGVDGVGVIFPFFCACFAFLRILSLFFSLFLRFSSPSSPKGQGKQQQFTAKMGNFTPTPSAPTPCKTSRKTLQKTSVCDPGLSADECERWTNFLSSAGTGKNFALFMRVPNPSPGAG